MNAVWFHTENTIYMTNDNGLTFKTYVQTSSIKSFTFSQDNMILYILLANGSFYSQKVVFQVSQSTFLNSIGPTAYTGTNGTNGTNGISYTGPTGYTGTNGTNGTNGISYTGPTGYTGTNGTNGISYTGPTGYTGTNCTNGISYTGPTG